MVVIFGSIYSPLNSPKLTGLFTFPQSAHILQVHSISKNIQHFQCNFEFESVKAQTGAFNWSWPWPSTNTSRSFVYSSKSLALNPWPGLLISDLRSQISDQFHLQPWQHVPTTTLQHWCKARPTSTSQCGVRLREDLGRHTWASDPWIFCRKNWFYKITDVNKAAA